MHADGAYLIVDGKGRFGSQSGIYVVEGNQGTGFRKFAARPNPIPVPAPVTSTFLF